MESLDQEKRDMRQEAGARKKKTPRPPAQGRHGPSHSHPVEGKGIWQRGAIVAQAALRGGCRRRLDRARMVSEEAERDSGLSNGRRRVFGVMS
jgi:hypothetical protein